MQEVVRRQVLGPQLEARIDLAVCDLEQLDPEQGGQAARPSPAGAVPAAPTRGQRSGWSLVATVLAMAIETTLAQGACAASLQGPHRMLIGGEWVESSSGKTFATIDPASGEEIAQVPYADAEDVDRAVQAAREAFDDGPWTDGR